MGIVAQATGVGTVTVAPCGDLHPGVPLIEVALGCRCSTLACLRKTSAQTELTPCAQQFILHGEHIEEPPAIALERPSREGLVVGNGAVILDACLVGQSLTDDIHEVVLEVVVALVFVGNTHHQFCRPARIIGVVVVFHLRPTRRLEIVKRWTGTEDALMGPLLVVAQRTVVNASRKHLPCLSNLWVGHAIACLHVLPHPLFLGEGLRPPGQFAHQLKHHGIVLRPLHGEPCATEMLCQRVALGRVEILDKLVHTAVKSHIGTEVLEHTEEPAVIAIALLTMPYRRGAPHRTAFAEEVEHHHIVLRERIEHLRTRILRPALHHPYRVGIGLLHRLLDGSSRFGIVDAAVVVALMKGVHGVEVGLAEEKGEFIVIHLGNLFEAGVGGHEVGRTLETVP